MTQDQKFDALTPELWQRLAQSYIRRRADAPSRTFVKIANDIFDDFPETRGIKITCYSDAPALAHVVSQFDRLLLESHANVPRLAEALQEARRELDKRPTRHTIIETLDYAELRRLAPRFFAEIPPAEILQRLTGEQLADALPLPRLVGMAAQRLTQEMVDRQEMLPYEITRPHVGNGHAHLTGSPLAEQVTSRGHKRIVFVGVRPRQEAKIKEALVDLCSVVFVDVVNGRPPTIPTCDFCIILVAQVSPTIAKQIAAGQLPKAVMVNSGGQSGLISKARQLLMSPVAAK